MVAMSHHNLGAMHEATKRADMTELNYKRAHDIAEQYLGPASQVAGTQFTGFTGTRVQTLTQKLEGAQQSSPPALSAYAQPRHYCITNPAEDYCITKD